MKLAIFYQHLLDAARQNGLPEEAALQMGVEFGYDMVECSYDHIKDDPEGFRKCLENYDLAVSCVYMEFALNHKIDLKEINEKLETAAMAGAEKVLIIPGFYDHNKTEKEAFQMETNEFVRGLMVICEEARKYAIKVLVEDFDNDRSPCCTKEQLIYLTQQIPDLQIAFDTGNFMYYLDDPVEAYPLLKDRIRHVHLKDRVMSPEHPEDKKVLRTDGSFIYPCAVCEGVAGTLQILEWLKQDGYDGILSVEHFGSVCEAELAKRSIQNVKAAWEN